MLKRSASVPVGKQHRALRRAQWDTTFALSCFFIGHHDCVDDAIHECAMDAASDSIRNSVSNGETRHESIKIIIRQ